MGVLAFINRRSGSNGRFVHYDDAPETRYEYAPLRVVDEVDNSPVPNTDPVVLLVGQLFDPAWPWAKG